MSLNNQQRGRIFERFIKEILHNSGFSDVIPDGQIIYSSSSGLMLQGLAQPHNADVLVDPPFQIPFFFPARLAVECKCYNNPLSLPVIRNALGLRADVNSFDIVTQEILEKRKDYRRSGPAVFDRERYFYQVAVASLSGFTKPAQEFALVHHIPLINIERMPFCQRIKEILLVGNSNDEYEMAEYNGANDDLLMERYWQMLLREVGHVFRNLCVGILQSGDILFIYTENNKQWLFDVRQIGLYWTNDKKFWKIRPYEEEERGESWFEIPDVLFKRWAQMEFDKIEALNIKKENFRYIYVMGKDERGKAQFNILKLSGRFIDEVRENLLM